MPQSTLKSSESPLESDNRNRQCARISNRAFFQSLKVCWKSSEEPTFLLKVLDYGIEAAILEAQERGWKYEVTLAAVREKIAQFPL